MRTLFVLIAALALSAQAQDIDPRFGGEPARDADGKIIRSKAQRARFIMMYPCPVNKQVTGACPDWEVDHIVPMSCGGIDAPVNMQWLPVQIKRCAGQYCKDRFERRVYRTTFDC